MKVKPLLSCEVGTENIRFPVYVSTKFDGIRALVINGVVYSRSLKPIRNNYVQKIFGKKEYEGFDGELIVGDTYAPDVFQKTTSGVMSKEGEPDVTFHVFDLWSMPTLDYENRQRELQEILTANHFDSIEYVPIHKCYDTDNLTFYLEHERNMGGEGLIGRTPNGVYKYGRSTPKEQLSIKFKFFEQDEFEVVGFNERMHNTNEQTRDELGYAERSTSKDGLVPMNTLGSLILQCGDMQFACGTGFNDVMRQEIWANKSEYLGKLVSIRYMIVGSKDLPRVPSFVGFRDVEDLGDFK